MNRKLITVTAMAILAFTSCSAQQRHMVNNLVDTDDPPVPSVVVIGTPQYPEPSQVDAVQCQTGPGPDCTPNPVVGDAEFVCGGDQQVDTCEGLYGLPTQVGSAPRLP